MGDQFATVPVYDVEAWMLMEIGDRVPVTYRIGKSGLLYIDSWEAPPGDWSIRRDNVCTDNE